MVFAVMLGVSVMAVQNTLVQLSFIGAPATAVMTTNVTRLVMDLDELLANRSKQLGTVTRARRTGVTIAGFVAGCAFGGWCQALAGQWSLALPTALALTALALASIGRRSRECDSSSSEGRGETGIGTIANPY